MKKIHRGMASIEALLAIATGALVLMGIMQLTTSSILPKANETIAKLIKSDLTLPDSSPSSTGDSDSTPEDNSDLGSDSDGSSDSQGQEDNGDGQAPDDLGDRGDADGGPQDNTDEWPFPDAVQARRQEISDLLNDPNTSEAERILLLAELTEIDRNHASKKADQLETTAQRLDRQASVADAFGDEERANELRAESERRKLEAARIRDGEKGFASKQKQIDAANAMRDLFDVTDNFSDLLPKPVEKVYDWVKYPIRDGLPQITEEIIEAEQGFHEWLREKVRNNPSLSEKVDRARSALNEFLRR